MAEDNKQKDKDQFLKDFVLELKQLNDIEIEFNNIDAGLALEDTRPLFLNEFEIAFAKHLLKFKKAYALGKKFAKEVTGVDKSDS